MMAPFAVSMLTAMLKAAFIDLPRMFRPEKVLAVEETMGINFSMYEVFSSLSKSAHGAVSAGARTSHPYR